MINIELISVIVFFIIVGSLLFRDRKNIEFSYGIIIRRWKKGKEIIDNVVKKRKKLIAIIGVVGIAVSVIASVVGMYLLVSCAFFPQFMPKGVLQDRCFKLVLPSVPGIEQYYPQQVFGIPFWYWLISIFAIVFFHESMHAIYTRLEKVPIKSYGLLFLLVLPIGAFVDPDNSRLKKLKTLPKLRIYAAGSFGNLILALIVAGLMLGISLANANIFEAAGVKFNNTEYNTPAYNASLSGIIYQVNDTKITNINNFSVFLSSIKPNDTIILYTTDNTYTIRTAVNPSNISRAYIGISGVSNAYRYKIFSQGIASDFVVNTISSFQMFLLTLFVLSLGVGIVNMLPLKPFDGGLFFEEIAIKLFGKKVGNKLTITVSLIILGLIIFNLFFTPIKLF